MMKLHEQVIRPEDLKIIKLLPADILKQFYMAGGTALALRIGHRYSNDFDFFTRVEFKNDILKNVLGKTGNFQLFQESRGILEGNVGNSRMSFLFYDYPQLEEGNVYKNIRIASLPDITAMKLSAISGRGERKDFIDLFFLKDIFTWDNLITLFQKKYKNAGFNLYHLIKSLGYFKDAEREPMPNMIQPCDWKEIVQYFKTLQGELSGLYL